MYFCIYTHRNLLFFIVNLSELHYYYYFYFQISEPWLHKFHIWCMYCRYIIYAFNIIYIIYLISALFWPIFQLKIIFLSTLKWNNVQSLNLSNRFHQPTLNLFCEYLFHFPRFWLGYRMMICVSEEIKWNAAWPGKILEFW